MTKQDYIHHLIAALEENPERFIVGKTYEIEDTYTGKVVYVERDGREVTVFDPEDDKSYTLITGDENVLKAEEFNSLYYATETIDQKRDSKFKKRDFRLITNKISARKK